MTEREHQLRAALHELADRAAPVDLSGRAHDRAGEIRRRRTAAVAVTAVAAVVITIGGATQLLALPDQPAPAVSPTEGPVQTAPPTPSPSQPSTGAPSDPPSAPPSDPTTEPPTAAPVEPTELVGQVTYQLTTTGEQGEAIGTAVYAGPVGAAPELVATVDRVGEVSPDGTLLAYAEPIGPSGYAQYLELWVSRLDGSDARPLGYLPMREGRWFSWSPDSTRLAVTDLHQTDPPDELVRGLGPAIVPVDGSPPTVLSAGWVGGVSPVWSPDGALVAFREGQFTGSDAVPSRIVVAPVSAPGTATEMPTPEDLPAVIESVSDDGTRVLFGDEAGDARRVVVTDLTTGEAVQASVATDLHRLSFVGPTTATALRLAPGGVSLVLLRVPAAPDGAEMEVLDEAPLVLPDGWAGLDITFVPDPA